MPGTREAVHLYGLRTCVELGASARKHLADATKSALDLNVTRFISADPAPSPKRATESLEYGIFGYATDI